MAVRRFFLFSLPNEAVMDDFCKEVFYKVSGVFGYMPADGGDKLKNEEYIPFWKSICEEYGWEFLLLDNSSSKDVSKIESCDSIFITGGNTFKLLYNLRENGFDKKLEDVFMDKDRDLVLAGFSAGAVIFTPSIRVAGMDWSFGPDVNEVGLENLIGLSFVNFEVVPHYNEKLDTRMLNDLRLLSENEIVEISDNSFLTVDLES